MTSWHHGPEDTRPDLAVQGGELLEEARQVDDDAVADQALRFSVQDARRDEVQLVLVALGVVDRVPCVGAALRSNRDWFQAPVLLASKRDFSKATL